MSADPLYGPEWSNWIMRMRSELGSRELAEVVYRASQHFVNRRSSHAGGTASEAGNAKKQSADPRDGAGSASLPETSSSAAGSSALFGDQEGRIARANLGRDPLYFFAALQRQLNYPSIPRTPRVDEGEKLPPALEARLLKLEQRLKLVEMEQRGGIDLSSYFRKPESSDDSALNP